MYFCRQPTNIIRTRTNAISLIVKKKKKTSFKDIFTSYENNEKTDNMCALQAVSRREAVNRNRYYHSDNMILHAETRVSDRQSIPRVVCDRFCARDNMIRVSRDDSTCLRRWYAAVVVAVSLRPIRLAHRFI